LHTRCRPGRQAAGSPEKYAVAGTGAPENRSFRHAGNPRFSNGICQRCDPDTCTVVQLNTGASKIHFNKKGDTISLLPSPYQAPARAGDRPREGAAGRLCCLFLLCAIGLAFIAAGVAAETVTIAAPPVNATSPQVVKIGVYVMDFKSFNVEEGSVKADFYLSLRSGANVSLSDLELVNGHITTADTLRDTPGDKYYRIYATMDADPDLRLYPFDRHALTIEIEPKTADSESLVFVTDNSQTGLDTEAQFPGWEYRTNGSLIEDYSYGSDEVPYSRAIFFYGIQRDTASTVLKFFLPIMLIIIVSLSSLLMKVSSRLGLNASMFLAAVLIHWRVADAIPLVAYATFLDIFMIITYATLVMVLVSGILLMKYTETQDTAKAERVYRWSIRLIPPVSIVLYIVLFVAFLR
jgi:hypothetical protein